MPNSPSQQDESISSPPSEKKRSTLFVGSLEKAFKVLHAFDGPKRHMTLADIARTTGLDRSATQRLVHTLEVMGYLRRIPETRNYGLAPKLLQLSYNYIRANELVDKASPYLLDISRTVGETTNLHELDGPDIVFLARFPGQHMVNVDIAVGSRLPAFFTASGTAILSKYPESRRREILAQTDLRPITPYTETDPQKLLDRVQKAAERGYAMVKNETVLGDISIAAPVADHRGNTISAINIAVPTTRWTSERVEAELAQYVQVAATSISKSKFGRYSS
ncbi:MAG: IclR family transcriptional regulator [Burkholderiaceae bacterium]|nr:IclR family transcriptional regulator [Burkholderiaceae bacterium]